MPDLLLELFSEEIPARMQRKAADDLKTLVTNALVDAGLVYEGAQAFATPRRLALHVVGLPVRGSDVREERKGPRVGSPDGAIQGFLRAAGLTSLDQATIETDPKKGQFYVATTTRAGRATPEVVAEIVPAIIRSFPWPKSMRWGAASGQAGALRWVRPLQSILCTFGPETEEPEVVPFSIDGLPSGNTTRGHRFHGNDSFRVRRFEDYVTGLEARKVVLDAERRKQIILADARTLAFAQGLELIEDDALADEVAGLVEWPVVLMGAFEPAFLDIPAEIIRATIRANQKCFVLRDPASEKLANRFILVSNLNASDGGQAIVAGNGRVIRARLSDALHFWKTDQSALPNVADYGAVAEKLGLDLAKPLDQRMAKLAHLDVVFHEKLGTQGERVARIAALAADIAPLVGADPALARRAAVLAKADLTTEVVGEFPELQGLIGRRYAALQGEHDSVCAAIEEHYKPQGPGDTVPSDPVSIAVALADKLDVLVGFWAIDEKPTGSKDPFALRRAALGVIRILLENGVRVKFLDIAWRPTSEILGSLTVVAARKKIDSLEKMIENGISKQLARIIHDEIKHPFTYEGSKELANDTKNWSWGLSLDLLAFFHDRLKVQLRDAGARHDLVDAVLAAGSFSSTAGKGEQASAANDDLVLVVRRLDALAAFLDTEDGKNLLAGYRRAANILRNEEKKDGAGAFDGAVDPALLTLPQEKLLHDLIGVATAGVTSAVAREGFVDAMQALAALRPAVDAFFDHVTVNADDPAVRVNRLRLLGELRHATLQVADFSKIAG